MADALDRVKREFGQAAVILNTRTETKGGLFGVGAAPYVEITAARRMSDLPPSLQRGTIPGSAGRETHGERADGAAAPMLLTTRVAESQASSALLAEVGSLKTLVHDLVRETRQSQVAALPDELYKAYLKLVENSVGEESARLLVEDVRSRLTDDQLHDSTEVRKLLAQAMESMLPTAGPIRLSKTHSPMIIALVGPTGVGKTTTIAKLAANLTLREKRKVGLITVDTYRIAAVEQLRTYAEIIDVPLEVVMTPRELKDAVARMSDREVILIDTAGRSQRDQVKLKELSEFFESVKPDEVHLVLSATCGQSVLTETVRRFRDVGVDRVIFTKLDETIGFGVILTCLQLADAQLSYVTTGQDVPDDIRVGEGNALAKLILGERSDMAIDSELRQ